MIIVCTTKKLFTPGHKDFIVNKIISAFQDDENFIMVPTDGYLTIATADSCDLSFDDAEH